MTEQNTEWISHRKVDYSNEKITKLNVDTRTFSVLAETEPHDFTLPAQYDAEDREYFFTSEEIRDLLERLFVGSGGDRVSFRILTLIGATVGWELKYLYIFRKDKDFVVCDRNRKPKDKKYFDHKIENPYGL